MQHAVITGFVYLFPLTMPFSSDLALFNGTRRGYGVGSAAAENQKTKNSSGAGKGKEKKRGGMKAPSLNQTFLYLLVTCCGSRGRVASRSWCNGGTERFQSHELRGSCRTRANGYLKRRFWLP